VMIGGKPALNNTSKLTCAKGMPMCIGIVMGCATVQVP
jgi:hypothetical protein